jgi:prepilin-type N-terminal cleavage/methylation domain-containing protein
MVVFKNNMPRQCKRYAAHCIQAFMRPKVLSGCVSGFTLIEVLVALFVAMLVLGPVFVLQSNVIKRSRSSANGLIRLLAQKTFLQEAEFSLDPSQDQFSKQKKITSLTAPLTYSLKKIPENSSLKKFKNLYVESVAASWNDTSNKKRTDTLVTFLYRQGES